MPIRTFMAHPDPYRSLVEHAPYGIFRSTPDGRILTANPALVRMLGYASEDELVELDLERDVYVRAAERRRLVEEYSTESYSGVVTRWRRADGVVIPVRMSGRPVREDGSVQAFESFVEDIPEDVRTEAELRETREHHRTLVEHLPDAVVIHDGERIVFANPRAADLVGVEGPGAVVGRPILDLVPPGHRDSVRERIETLLSSGEAMPPLNLPVRRANGTTATVEITGMAVRWEGRRAVLVVGRDVTERLELQEKAEEGRRIFALTTMAAGMAHQFNNRLTVLRGHADLALLDLPEDHHLRDDIRAIVDNARAAGRLAERILTFAGGRQGRSRLVELPEVVRRTVESVRSSSGEKITLDVRNPGRPMQVEADPEHVQEAVRELLGNAVDAISDGGTVSMTLEGGWLDEPHPGGSERGRPARVFLRAEDTGRGMDDEELSHCREPFFSTKPADGARGLGLSTVHGVARKMNAELAIESEPGEGTVAELRIPLAERVGSEKRAVGRVG